MEIGGVVTRAATSGAYDLIVLVSGDGDYLPLIGEAMRDIRRVFLIASTGFVLVMQAMFAFASGREGEAFVEPVVWIVAIVLVTFATLVFGGGFLGAFRASQSGASILKGSAHGLLRGMVAFLVVGAVAVTGLTILGILWVAYSFLYVYVSSPS